MLPITGIWRFTLGYVTLLHLLGGSFSVELRIAPIKQLKSKRMWLKTKLKIVEVFCEILPKDKMSRRQWILVLVDVVCR